MNAVEINSVEIVSRRMVHPDPASTPAPEETSIDLTPWDLRMITSRYINKAILLPKPAAPTTGGVQGDHGVVERLASSLARALGRFYPYAGRLVVAAPGDGSISISLRCSGEGAEFVQAVAPDVTVADIVVPLQTPRVVRSFFPLGELVGADGVEGSGSRPLLAAQVTELADGIFVGMSLNHAVADGSAFWHLFNTWSEASRLQHGDGASSALPLPVHRRWFSDRCAVPIPLPFGKLEDIVVRQQQQTEERPSVVDECFFHFSAESIKRLKAKANAEVSSLQALLAHLWLAVCRAWRLAPDHWTGYALVVGCRGRLDGVPAAYAGNALSHAMAMSTTGEILDKGLGWAASLLNQAVASFDQASERDRLAAWTAKPSFASLSARPTAMLLTGSSPRFDVYGNDFGWGPPVAVRSGAADKVDGTATVYEGRGGGGSMALEVCLTPEVLARLLSDNEFMSAVSA